MSKRQRRRVIKRRSMHVDHVKRRGALDPRLPIALAAVAATAHPCRRRSSRPLRQGDLQNVTLVTFLE